jgi:hypothetical protein
MEMPQLCYYYWALAGGGQGGVQAHLIFPKSELDLTFDLILRQLLIEMAASYRFLFSPRPRTKAQYLSTRTAVLEIETQLLSVASCAVRSAPILGFIHGWLPVARTESRIHYAQTRFIIQFVDALNSSSPLLPTAPSIEVSAWRGTLLT